METPLRKSLRALTEGGLENLGPSNLAEKAAERMRVDIKKNGHSDTKTAISHAKLGPYVVGFEPRE